ncbi:putative tail assembly chaperone [Salmonella phage St162]|uniref:Putative tail assembly chaperone n=1 Tax=Salmonella phage St162 TaxID=2024312 RepID=A0A291AX90_9CAUD|nr:putative tail assembly chaperone [Salmonella phage St162]ATE85639.1 putative tail assembly chaperone [Salmonella phage St162]
MMELKDFFFADKHAAGTLMPIPLPSGEDSGEWLRVVGPASDVGVKAGRDYHRAYFAIKEELSELDQKCKDKNDWSQYNAEFNWRADELNDALAIAVVTGWSFDESFSKDVLKKLLNEYKGLGTVVAKHFHDSRKSLMEK